MNAYSKVHDAWLRTKVQEALDDPRPAIPNDEVAERFAKRRAAALNNWVDIELKRDWSDVSED